MLSKVPALSRVLPCGWPCHPNARAGLVSGFPGAAGECQAVDAVLEVAAQSPEERGGWGVVGDYTLYWTGLFPEGLGACKGPKDYFLDYCEQGKESYSIASRLSHDDDVPPAPLLRRLSSG